MHQSAREQEVVAACVLPQPLPASSSSSCVYSSWRAGEQRRRLLVCAGSLLRRCRTTGLCDVWGWGELSFVADEPSAKTLSFFSSSFLRGRSESLRSRVRFPFSPQPSLNSLAGTAETESELFKLLPFDRKSFNIKRKNKQRTSKQAQKQLASCFFFFDVAILECACAKFGVGSIFFFMWRGAPWLHFSLDVFRVCFLRILHRLLA